MTSPDQRADSGARNAAIKIVDEALKSGRIVQADRDMRVNQLNAAQTMQDVDLVVRDLGGVGSPTAPPTIAPVAATPTGTQQPWPLVNYGPGANTTVGLTGIAPAASKGGRAIGGVIAAIILVSVVVPIAGAVIAFFAARDSFPDFGSVGPTDDTTYAPGEAPGEDGVNLFTVDGFEEMVDAVKDEKGGDAYVFDASIFPRYASIELPTGTRNRYQTFYWNGEELQLQTIKGTTEDKQVDLGLIDAQVVIDCVTKVRDRTENPENWYAIISDPSDNGGQISCYASNDFSESSYVIETLDGTVIYDSEAQP